MFIPNNKVTHLNSPAWFWFAAAARRPALTGSPPIPRPLGRLPASLASGCGCSPQAGAACRTTGAEAARRHLLGQSQSPGPADFLAMWPHLAKGPVLSHLHGLACTLGQVWPTQNTTAPFQAAQAFRSGHSSLSGHVDTTALRDSQCKR